MINERKGSVRILVDEFLAVGTGGAFSDEGVADFADQKTWIILQRFNV